MSKICKCGHDGSWHTFVKPPACDFDDCGCERFEIESGVKDE